VTLYGKEDRHAEIHQESINADLNHMFLEELRHFVACAETGAPPALDAAAGARVLGIALAAKSSAREGRPVRLPA
ncbi:MAG: Gfo/Idh/MocA family oxidoreductase, partial [Gemmatimonadales bacterium]